MVYVGGQSTATGGSGMDKGKEWQMELLMEKLRSKASTFKSLVETAKNLRMAMLVIYVQCIIQIIFNMFAAAIEALLTHYALPLRVRGQYTLKQHVDYFLKARIGDT